MTTQIIKGWRLAAILLLLAGTAALAKVPEPDKLIYGTITLDGQAVTAFDGSNRYDVSRYTVEVRSAPDAEPLRSYVMGSSSQFHPYFYGLRVTLEAFGERLESDALIGDTLYLVLKDGTNEVLRQTCVVASRGPTRLDFGGVADSDGDGLSDLDEVDTYKTNPGKPDTDGDGLTDGDEVHLYGTDPNKPDSDGDGQSDGEEVAHGSDPRDPDSFGVNLSGAIAYSGGQTSGLFSVLALPWPDEKSLAESNAVGETQLEEAGPYVLGPLANGKEYVVYAYRDSNGNGTQDTWEAAGICSNYPILVTGALAGVDFELTDPDSDLDGLPDYRELFEFGSDPENADSDGDGLDDSVEALVLGTDPANPDSDGDGLGDGLEVDMWGTDPLNPDSDDDGLPDGWEADSDGDGLVDYREIHEFKTDPTVADTDGDGLSDGDEVNLYRTKPRNPDSDGDGLSDGDEVATYKTLPTLPDTDGDGVADGLEVNTYKSDPLKPDSDGDGLSDGEEVEAGTDPMLEDTDSDGLSDRAEIKTHKTNPLKRDTDKDGLADGAEILVHGTDPLLADTDGDQLSDGAEIKTYHTNPGNRDSDGDGLNDYAEVKRHGTNPNSGDTDRDGLGDAAEARQFHTNPALADTDGDGIKDGRELNQTGTDPLRPDTDNDGLNDGAELVAMTQPLNPDTDGDGLTDGKEVNYYGTDPLDPKSRLASIYGSVDWAGAPTGKLHVVASRWPSRILNLNGGADGLAVTGLVYGAARGVGNMTVEGWLLTTARGTNAIVSFGRDKLWKLSVGDDLNGGFSGRLAFDTIDAGGNPHAMKGTARVNDGRWHHVAVSYSRESGSKTIYVDGAVDAAAPAAHAPGSLLGWFAPGEKRFCLIGRGWDHTDTAFEGLLDEIRIWSRVLPPEEVKRSMSFQPADRRSDLVGNWHFDDGTGRDASSAQRPGVFLGGARTVKARTVWGGLSQAAGEGVQRMPGVFAITNLPTLRSYYVFAYLDSNKNGSRQYWEAFGAATSTVYLATDVKGIDLQVLDSTITTEPGEGDTDLDGKTDAEEIYRYGTDPGVFD